MCSKPYHCKYSNVQLKSVSLPGAYIHRLTVVRARKPFAKKREKIRTRNWLRKTKKKNKENEGKKEREIKNEDRKGR